MEEYKALLRAKGILQWSADAVYKEEKDSPAWYMLIHAIDHVQESANRSLRF